MLAKVPDRTQREEYLARAADRWGGSFPGRTEAMERVLRMELGRLLGRQRGPREGAARRDPGFITDTLTGRASGVLTAETELLSMALDDEEVARIVAAQLEPADMIVPADATILLALKDQLADGGSLDASALVDALPEEEGARERGVELVVAQEGAGEDVRREDRDEMLQRAICRLRGYRPEGPAGRAVWQVDTDRTARAGTEDLEQLKRRVLEGINSGQMSQDDPDYRRYCELIGVLRGPGAGGYVQDVIREEAAEQPPPVVAAPRQRPAPVPRPAPPAAEESDPWQAEEGDPFQDSEDEA